jgi:hypothetical protein
VLVPYGRNVDTAMRDMVAAYDKVFLQQDPELRQLRRWAYGRLHAMLTASFVRAGEYRRFAGHSVASVAARPGRVGCFAGYPVRALRRYLAGSRVG